MDILLGILVIKDIVLLKEKKTREECYLNIHEYNPDYHP